MKTITELNSKWWYRALKVVFIITFLLVTVAVVGITYSDLSDAQNLVAHCDNGKEIIKDEYDNYTDEEKYHTYRECSEADYQISQSSVGKLKRFNQSTKVLSQEQRNELDVIVLKMTKDGSSDEEIQTYVNNFKEINGTIFDPSNYGAIPTEKGNTYTHDEVFGNMDLSNGWIKRIDNVSILANYKTSLEPKYSPLTLIGFVLISIMATIVAFWLITRIFFYIILGEKLFKLKPSNFES